MPVFVPRWWIWAIMENMMAWFHITSGQLKENGELDTPLDKSFTGTITAIQNPIVKWRFSHKYPVWQ